MKRKLLAMFLFTTVINAHALTAQNAKLIGHTETIARNTAFTLDQSKNDRIGKMLQSKLRSNSNPDNIEVQTSFGDIKIVAGGTSILKASDFNALYILNFAAEPKTYKIKHEICVGPRDEPATACSSTTDTVVIDSEGSYLDTVRPSLEIALKAGDYDASIWTTVERENNIVVDSFDFRPITVSNK